MEKTTKSHEPAEIAKITPEWVLNCEESMRTFNDLKISIDTAREEGRTKGYLESMLEGEKNMALKIAKNGIRMGISIEDIQDLTGLSENDIKSLV